MSDSIKNSSYVLLVGFRSLLCNVAHLIYYYRHGSVTGNGGKRHDRFCVIVTGSTLLSCEKISKESSASEHMISTVFYSSSRNTLSCISTFPTYSIFEFTVFCLIEVCFIVYMKKIICSLKLARSKFNRKHILLVMKQWSDPSK